MATRWQAALCLCVCVATTAGAGAQEQRGRVIGVVTDNTKSVLPGVTVTATSPSLIQPQVTVSLEDGTYRFPSLATGVYALTFELTGFQTLRREGIQVALNTTVTIDAEVGLSGVRGDADGRR